MNNSLYGNYRTKRFTEVFPSYEVFKEFYTNQCAIPLSITEESLRTLYYLLYARYGNDVVANSDQNQFKYLMGSIIFQYGPSWEKELEVQKTLRGLTESDLITGATQINNHAYNPQTAPTTTTTVELDYIDDQNVNKYSRGKLDGYSFLMQLLKTDVTESFLLRFRPCFLVVVAPQVPLWYVTPIGDSTSEDSQEVGPNFCV